MYIIIVTNWGCSTRDWPLTLAVHVSPISRLYRDRNSVLSDSTAFNIQLIEIWLHNFAVILLSLYSQSQQLRIKFSLEVAKIQFNNIRQSQKWKYPHLWKFLIWTHHYQLSLVVRTLSRHVWSIRTFVDDPHAHMCVGGWTVHRTPSTIYQLLEIYVCTHVRTVKMVGSFYTVRKCYDLVLT